MRNPSPETFERAFADLSRSARAAFVADLWAVRGWETRVETDGRDCHVVCTRGDERSVILVAATTRYERLRRGVASRLRRGEAARPDDDTETHASVDIVVTAGSNPGAGTLPEGTDAHVYDARSLYDLALYGLARDAANDLFQRHLSTGLTVSPDPTPAPDEDGPADSVGGSWLPGLGVDLPLAPQTLVAVIGVVVLVGALVAGGVGSGGFGRTVTGASNSSLETPDASAQTPSDSAASEGFGDADPFGTGPPDGSGPDTLRSEVPLVAPGLTADGQVGANALAAAHAEQVDGRSYVWRVNYTEQSAGTVSRATVTHRVRNASVHRVDIETTGVITTDPGQLVPRPAYADGDRRQVLSDGRVLQRAVESRDHYAGHAETVFSRLLRANESEIVAGRTVRDTFLYEVSLSGSPVATRQSYRATALVTPEGVVHVVEAQWVERDSGATVSVRTTYDFEADPNVTRPEWARSVTEAPAANATILSPRPTVAGE